MKSIFSHIKTLFLSGLFTILPIVCTFFILSFTYDSVAKILQPLRLIEPEVLQKIPGSEFALVTLFIILIGLLVKLFFVAPLIAMGENLITKIPVIRTIYSATKTLVDFFNLPTLAQDEKKRKVILVEYPRKGMFNIAFLLEPATDNFQKIIPDSKLLPGKKYFKVFMPTTPNPTTGFTFIISEDEFVLTDLTFEEGLKTVVSCGLITPESVKSIARSA